MENREVYHSWLNHGDPSSFSLSNYYSSLLLDEEGKADYVFHMIGLSVEDVLSSDNPTVNLSLNDLDNVVRDVSILIEEFVKKRFLSPTEYDVENVKEAIDDLDYDMKDLYDEKIRILNTISGELGGRIVSIDETENEI